MTEMKQSHGMNIHARRFISYLVLILLSFLCLIWFYILFINATRSNAELTRGFTPIPSSYLLTNWQNLLNGTLPVVCGMGNSFIVAGLSAVLCTYFSTMTAYAIHAYNFKLKKFMFTFILMIMMIPTQVTALGFIRFVTKLKLMLHPADRSVDRCTGHLFLYEAVYGLGTSDVPRRGGPHRRRRRVPHL